MTNYSKLSISLRYWLLGKEYHLAAEALAFASTFHTGFRKDGVTPEFQHQVQIAHYLRTLLPSLTLPEETIAAAILHDTSEDYSVANSEIERLFGPVIAKACFLLDKNGKTSEGYFEAIANDQIASIVKGADRINNCQTMHGVFSVEKQKRYVDEVNKYFLPMLKLARRNFARQEAAYENIKHVLKSQVELIELTWPKEEQ